MKEKRNYMRNKLHKILSVLLVIAMAFSLVLSGCGKKETVTKEDEKTEEAESEEYVIPEYEEKGPKYIFLFIGDGMSYPQIQLASYYFQKVEGENRFNMEKLGFSGNATTYNQTSLIPDSASTVTAMASGNKTVKGALNTDCDETAEYTTIAETLKETCGYKIGIISSVNVNHATPAGFYAKEDDRDDFYDVGKDMIASDFDYFAGGNILLPNGPDGESDSLYDLAKSAGYDIYYDTESAMADKDRSDKCIVVSGDPSNNDTISMAIDAINGYGKTDVSLSDMLSTGISRLDNENGFFIMCEGGMIDWACHANDATALVYEVKAFDEALGEALKFYSKHPDETLIIVTADHETGGLTLGYANTEYDLNLELLKAQKISFKAYDNQFITTYKDAGKTFEQAMDDIHELFGLTMPEKADTAEDPRQVLTAEEVDELRTAYEVMWNGFPTDEYGNTIKTADEYNKYGNKMPFTVTVLHILNHKAGVDFSTYSHTALTAPVFAIGNGADNFSGYYDDTDIYKKLMKMKDLYKNWVPKGTYSDNEKQGEAKPDEGK